MSIQDYLEKMRKIQNNLLNFLEIEDQDEENYENLIKLFNEYQIPKNRYDLKTVIYLIMNISNNHNRGANFFEKIEKILTFFKVEIKNFYSNKEIFNLFKGNKRILLFIIKEELLTMDIQIARAMISFREEKYEEYFQPELSPFMEEISKAGNQFGNPISNFPAYPMIPPNQFPYNPVLPLYLQNTSPLQLYPMNPMTQINQMYPINPMTQINQMYPINPMTQINQMYPINPMNQMYPMNQINPMNQVNQMNQANSMLPANTTTPSISNMSQSQADTKKVQAGPKLPDDFEEKRKIGENDDPICEIIRKDQIEEFITHVKTHNISLRKKIIYSIYETNTLFVPAQANYNYFDNSRTIGSSIELIEYAAFFGSIQIFNYLYKNGVELTSSLWIFAIHGQNPELIRILEDSGIKPRNESYIKCFEEAIKCHHNGIANYIENNFLLNEEDSSKLMSDSLQYYNFAYISDNLKRSEILELCKYDYYTLIDLLSKAKNIDVNYRIIFFILFLKKCSFECIFFFLIEFLY